MPARAFLLKELVRRDLRGRYAGSAFGLAWAFVHPLVLLGLYTFVFSTVLRVHPTGERTEHFAVFLFAGMLPWLALQEGASRGATAITDNAVLLKHRAFPAELLILSVILTALVHEGIALGVFVAVVAAMGQLDVSAAAWLAVALPLQVLLTLGLGLMLATAHVVARDTAQIVALGFMAWFFLTPIVYPMAMVPDAFRIGLELNPATALVTMYRAALLGADGPSLGALMPLLLVSVLSVVAGTWLFRRLEGTFADQI